MADSSLDKALRLLLCFTPEHPVWGIRELAQALGFSPPTVQRMVRSLCKYGFLEQDQETRRYRPGFVYFRFVETIQSQFPLERMATPVMKALCAKTGETTHLNVIDGKERLCISSIESPQHLKGGMPVGNRSPLYAGASSKCLLAFSEDTFIEDLINSLRLEPLTENTITDRERLKEEIRSIRLRGYSMSLGERTPGLGSLSVPVFGPNGNILGALSLAIPEVRFRDVSHRNHCLKELLNAGEKLSRSMGYGGKYPKELSEEGQS